MENLTPKSFINSTRLIAPVENNLERKNKRQYIKPKKALTRKLAENIFEISIKSAYQKKVYIARLSNEMLFVSTYNTIDKKAAKIGALKLNHALQKNPTRQCQIIGYEVEKFLEKNIDLLIAANNIDVNNSIKNIFRHIVSRAQVN